MSRCDIVIPVWNQLTMTRECLGSIYKNTYISYRLIIIDNGSDRETREYLESVSRDNKFSKVTLLRNEKNIGALGALNQGMSQANAEFICLLNNDTLVGPGWLTEMIKVAESRADIGTVNPNSNTLGHKSREPKSLESIAQKLRCYSGEWSELAWAHGFCMLIKRKVLQEVGLFDEIYGMGTFEDADFSKRAQRLGYFCVCAKAAYVYHHERSSFKKFKSFNKDFERNRQIFYAKWGRLQRILYVLTKDNPAYKDKVAKVALRLAREGNIIWFFLKDKDKLNIDHHSNIYIYKLPGFFFSLASLWRILKRKKKFDKIYVDDEVYRKRLNNLKSLHKAEVIHGQ